MKSIIVSLSIIISVSAFSQRLKDDVDAYAQLFIDVTDINQNLRLDTFTVNISSVLGDTSFVIEGTYHQNFVLDTSARYKVSVCATGYNKCQYEWEYNQEEKNIRFLHVHFYPIGLTEKEKQKALKKYSRQNKKARRKENDGTCNGLHWGQEYII